MAKSTRSKPGNTVRKRGRPRSSGPSTTIETSEKSVDNGPEMDISPSSSSCGTATTDSNSSQAMMKSESASSPSFAVVPGLVVFAFHGPLLYQAKVRKIHRSNAQSIETEGSSELLAENPALDPSKLDITTYLLHYNGWNSKWDEWVSCDRILEFNEVNKLKKKEMDGLAKRKRQPQPAPPSPVKAPEESAKRKSPCKRSRSADIAMPLSSKVSYDILLAVSSELKETLVDDWENITFKKQLLQLPANSTVSTILSEYRARRLQVLTEEEQVRVLDEIIDGLAAYFDGLVGLTLLYRFENLQHLHFLKDETILSTRTPQHVFGFEHFLRLLVSLPECVGKTSMDPTSVAVMLEEVTVLLEFLHENRANFKGTYVNASPQYSNLAR